MPTDAPKDGGTVLMFSGGRDSTLAALRLAASGRAITLVTISSNHLVGVVNVKRRLLELAQHLPGDTVWRRIQQPLSEAAFGAAFSKTCLPCQHDYALAGAVVARELGVGRLAMGYASYQNDWPEQTQLATTELSSVLAEFGIGLDLPVYDLTSKEAAVAELEENGLSTQSLEQKCIKQVFNVALSDNDLKIHVAHWANTLRKSLNSSDIKVNILEEERLGCLEPLR